MRLAILFSGGKDSFYAIHKTMKEHEIACLISMISENKESYLFHTPNIELTEIQARALEIPIIVKKTKGRKEKELKDLKKAIKKAIKEFHVDGVVTGAIKSTYQASRFQRVCNDLNTWCFNPLWQKDQIELLDELIKLKFKIIITGVFSYPFDESWLGKIIDKRIIEKLRKLQESYEINPAGEGGEIETFVLGCPLYKHRLEIIGRKIEYQNYSGILQLKVKMIE